MLMKIVCHPGYGTHKGNSFQDPRRSPVALIQALMVFVQHHRDHFGFIYPTLILSMLLL